MALEEVPLRQLDSDSIYLFSYSGNLQIEDMGFRLYNDTSKNRVIRIVRGSLGSAPSGSGSGAAVDILKNGTTIFTPGVSPGHPYPGEYSSVYIPAGQHTATAEPRPDAIWLAGEYLTVSIVGIGSTFAGADLTIGVVVSE